MATGFIQRFKGKIIAKQLWLGSGGLIDAASGVAGFSDFLQKLAVQAVNAATTDYGPMSLPVGSTLLGATFYTTTAFTAVTDAKISIGATAGAQEYVAQVTVKALGVYALTLVNAGAVALAVLPAAPNLFVRITQSGGSTAVGTGVLVVNYVA